MFRRFYSQFWKESRLRSLNPAPLSVACVLLIVKCVAAGMPESQRHYPLSGLTQRNMKIGGHVLKVWMMDTEGEQEEGMMFLLPRDVRSNQGMLFVFSSPQPLDFWMKNTLMPLDIAFIDSNWRVVNVAAMTPGDLTPVPSAGPAEYALEAKPETFQRFDIKQGMTIKLMTK